MRLTLFLNQSLKPFHSIPGPKPLPLVGNIWRYLPVIGEYRLDTLFENAQFNKSKYGPIVREQLTSRHTILHLFDPHDIETFFRHDGKCPYRRSHRALLKYRRERPESYIDGGLFPENGQSWYRQRNQFQKYLKSKSHVASNIDKLDDMGQRVVERMANQLDKSNQVTIENFEQTLYRWALGNTVSVFMNLDIDTLDSGTVEILMRELHSTLHAIDKTEIQTEKWIRFPQRCPHYKALVRSQDYLHDFVIKHIKKSSSLDRDQPSASNYLSNWLISDELDQRDVVSFIIDTLMAGLHTTSYTIAFLLYHLSTNKRCQESVRDEILQNLPLESPISMEQVDKLTYLKDCLKESMRLNPVSIGTGRLTMQENLVIRNYEIPKGVMVITQNQVISRDETIFEEPNSFCPERWPRYKSLPRGQRPSPFATLPFGFGTRSCIAQNLAELQIKILTARLLQRFELTFADSIRTKTTLIHNIDENIKVTLNKVSR